MFICKNQVYDGPLLDDYKGVSGVFVKLVATTFHGRLKVMVLDFLGLISMGDQIMVIFI